MRRNACVLGLATASLLLSCQAADPDPGSDEDVGLDEAPIINGSADTTSKAVVWLFDENSGSSCTGTIIKVDGDTGYALTAAHCTNMDYVVVANDYTDCFGQGNPGCEAVFQVAQQIYHPDYNAGDPGQGYDFSLIRFGGASGWPYVIPAAQPPDGLSNGVSLDIVGYGQTESGQNSLRRHKVTQLVDFDLFFLLHQSTVCFGDSGGPAIYNGTVVGVSSFVTDNACMDYGVSGRVATVYQSFIEPFIGPPSTSTTSSSATTGATTGSGVGGMAGVGGYPSDGGAPPAVLDPDDDYEWYPGKQDGKDEDGDSSSCSASAGRSGGAASALGLVAALSLLVSRRRR
jgi:hypothetical protein